MTDLGYDLSCVDDLDDHMTEVTGRRLLGEACVRRLTTRRGGLIDDPDYGTDVRDYLNDDIDTREIARIGAAVDAELLKDERVLDCETTVTFSGGVLMLAILITDHAGPFTLVLAVSDVTVSLLRAA